MDGVEATRRACTWCWLLLLSVGSGVKNEMASTAVVEWRVGCGNLMDKSLNLWHVSFYRPITASFSIYKIYFLGW